MPDLTKYYLEEPIELSAFGSVTEVRKLPKEHLDQIHFLDKTGEKLLYEYLENSKMFYGRTAAMDGSKDHWPFRFNYFKTFIHSPSIDKKWLYNLGIPFKQTVYLLPGFGPRHAAVTTWKMIIKYVEDIEFSDDHYVFDESLNWGLLIHHDSEMFFGKDKLFDPDEGYQNTLLLNKIRSNLENKKGST